MSGWHYSREPGDAGQILAADGACAGHDLDVLIGRARPSLRAAMGIASAIADILCIAAEDRMVHGDIRTSHVRVDELGRVSIEGWGVARRATRAPEGRADLPAADIYGLGIVLHSMLSPTPLGQLPRDPEAHDDEVVERVLAMDFSAVEGRRWLEEVRGFLCNILAWHPDDRPLPLDAANVLASVATQCPGEDLVTWAWRAIRGAPRPAAAMAAPMPAAPMPVAAPFGHESRGARQAPAARGESTAAWTREKIAAMLAEEDDEDTRGPVAPGRPPVMSVASPFAAPTPPRAVAAASPFAPPPAQPMVAPSPFAAPPVPPAAAPSPFAPPPAHPMAAPSPFATPAPFAPPPWGQAPLAPAAPPAVAPPSAPPPWGQAPPSPAAPAAAAPPFAPPPWGQAPAPPAAPPAAAPPFAPPPPRAPGATPFAAPPFGAPSPFAGTAPPPPYRPAGSDLYDDVTDTGRASGPGSPTRGKWLAAGGALIALVVVGIVAIVTMNGGSDGEPDGSAPATRATPPEPTQAEAPTVAPSAVETPPAPAEPAPAEPAPAEPAPQEPTREVAAPVERSAPKPVRDVEAVAPPRGTQKARAAEPTRADPPPSRAPKATGSSVTTPAAASPGGEYTVRFSVPGRDARLQCGDGQAAEFSGNTTLRFTGTTTCLVKVDHGRGAIQLSGGGTVSCTEDSGKVSCSGP